MKINNLSVEPFQNLLQHFDVIFTCVSYAEARNSYRLDVRPSVRHTLAPYQNG